MIRYALLVSMTVGCAATLQPVPPTIPERQHVEKEPLPPDPATEKVEARDGDWAVPMDEEQCITKDGKLASDAPRPCPGRGGILLSEEKAMRLKLYQLGYQQLRVSYTADRQVWAAQRELYEARLRDAGEALQRAQPTWLEQNALQIGVVSGVILGAGLSIGLVYGLAPAIKTASNP